jgi:glycosyltransferase involved in cell wall biosynthesis
MKDAEMNRSTREMNVGTASLSASAEPHRSRASERPSRALRILHLDSERGWSGGQTQVYLLLGHLIRRGYANTVVSPQGGALLERCRSDGLQTYGVRMRHYADALSVVRLAWIFRRHSPDVIHMHSSTAHFLGVFARRLALSPAAAVFTRRMDYRLRRAPLMRLPYLHLTDRVVAISQGVRRALVDSGVPDRHIEVIRSSVDVDHFRPVHGMRAERGPLGISEAAPLLGVVAGLIPRKGHRYLFEAMPRILKGLPDAVLLVVGEGPLRGDLERLAMTLGISKSVRFAGRIEDVRFALACLDVLVLPSVAEGLGVSLLEGLAMGLPLVGSSVGGIPDVVRDDVTGYLVPPREPAALAGRILTILADPGLRLRMGKAGRRLAEAEFSREAMGLRYEALYRELLENRSSVARTPSQGGHSGPLRPSR